MFIYYGNLSSWICMFFFSAADLVNVFSTVIARYCDTWKKIVSGEVISDLVKVLVNIDGSEDHQMRFQGKPRGLPSDIIIG